MSATKQIIAKGIIDNRKPLTILIGGSLIAGGSYFLFRNYQKRRYMKLAADGNVNAIAAQNAYDILPISVKKTPFLYRIITPGVFFKITAEAENLFRSEDFKMRYYRIANSVTDRKEFYAAFRGMYGFSLPLVLEKFLSDKEIREFETEANREKVIATKKKELIGSYVSVKEPLGYNDVMFFLTAPQGWPGGYAWLYAKIDKGTIMGRHSGTELVKIGGGKTVMEGIKIPVATSYTIGGTKFSAQGFFIVNAKKVTITAVKPKGKIFNPTDYISTKQFYEKYITQLKKQREQAAKIKDKSLLKNVWEKFSS